MVVDAVTVAEVVAAGADGDGDIQPVQPALGIITATAALRGTKTAYMAILLLLVFLAINLTMNPPSHITNPIRRMRNPIMSIPSGVKILTTNQRTSPTAITINAATLYLPNFLTSFIISASSFITLSRKNARQGWFLGFREGHTSSSG
jgi:hypothetical protein